MTNRISFLASGLPAVPARGKTGTALRLCESFLSIHDLPPAEAAKAHRHAAEVEGRSGNFSAARRHLRAAARLEPEHAATRFLLGRAFDRDPFGSPRLAAKHYRAAVNRDGGNAHYRAAFGRAAVKAGLRATGCRALARAAAMAAGDVSVLEVVIDGLIEAGRLRTARRVATGALFRTGASREAVSLLNRVKFAEVRADQRGHRSAEILPFVRLLTTPAAGTPGVVIRMDAASRPRPHLTRIAAKRFRR